MKYYDPFDPTTVDPKDPYPRTETVRVPVPAPDSRIGRNECEEDYFLKMNYCRQKILSDEFLSVIRFYY